jgi:hypothetical protein
MRRPANIHVVLLLILNKFGDRATISKRFRLVIQPAGPAALRGIALDYLDNCLLLFEVDAGRSLDLIDCLLDLVELPHLNVPLLIDLAEVESSVLLKCLYAVLALLHPVRQINDRLPNILKGFLHLLS